MNGVLHTTTIQCVTKSFINTILNTECNVKYSEPHGLFYYYSSDDKKYVAMDNSDGDAWMEEFDSYGECVLWLLGIVDSDGEVVNGEKSIEEYFK